MPKQKKVKRVNPEKQKAIQRRIEREEKQARLENPPEPEPVKKPSRRP